VNSDPDEKPQRIRIIASEESALALENLSSFLYDLVLVHDRLLLFFNGDPSAARSGLSFNRRNGRRIQKSEKLQISLINKQSPLAIEVVIAAAFSTAMLASTLIHILQTLADRKLDRQLKEEQLRKLIRENAQPNHPSQHLDSYIEFENSLVRDATRLGANEQVTIEEVHIIRISQQDDKRG
jgi:hypothetical protein